MSGFSQLRDNFANNTIDPCWVAAQSGSATAAETGGQARFTLPSSTAGSHDASYTSAATYDLTGDGFVIDIQTMVATGVAATAYFDLLLDDSNYLRWRQLSNAITARTLIAGVDTQRYTATWSSSTYKYLRIRESGGTIFWDSSSNGTSWTNRASLANPFGVTALKIRFGASCGNVASPGSLRLDDVNLILPALSSTWRWTEVEWPLLYRFRSITIAATSGQGYIATSNDGTTWRFFSGPIGSASGGYNALVETAAQADAQAMAVNLPADGRWDLPQIVECRFIRLYHRSITGASYTLREYYPRRLIQSDDIEAESIKAINIAAGTITADKIAAHTITATQIGTVSLEATARITAGGDNVRLDQNGISLLTANTYSDFSAVKFYDSAGVTLQATLASWENGSTLVRTELNTSLATRNNETWLSAYTDATHYAAVNLFVWNPGDAASASLTLKVDAAGATTLTSDADVVTFNGLLTIGATAANEGGQVTLLRGTSGSRDWNIDVFSDAFRVFDSAGQVLFQCSGTPGIGFFATSPAAKQTVTGSRGGNAALASLLTALAAYGLITNSSSA